MNFIEYMQKKFFCVSIKVKTLNYYRARKFIERFYKTKNFNELTNYISFEIITQYMLMESFWEYLFYSPILMATTLFRRFRIEPLSVSYFVRCIIYVVDRSDKIFTEKYLFYGAINLKFVLSKCFILNII